MIRTNPKSTSAFNFGPQPHMRLSIHIHNENPAVNGHDFPKNGAMTISQGTFGSHLNPAKWVWYLPIWHMGPLTVPHEIRCFLHRGRKLTFSRIQQPARALLKSKSPMGPPDIWPPLHDIAWRMMEIPPRNGLIVSNYYIHIVVSNYYIVYIYI